MENMLETGTKCTIYPDNQEVFEIIDIKIKSLKSKTPSGENFEINGYKVDLRSIEDPNIKVKGVDLGRINLIE